MRVVTLSTCFALYIMKKKVKTKSAPQRMHVESAEEDEEEQQDVQSVESTELNGHSNKQTESDVASDADENEDNDDDDDEMDLANFKASAKTGKTTKKRKKGIIYISNIPKHMNVTRLREILGECGKIGRVYLQPEKKLGKWLGPDKSIITD